MHCRIVSLFSVIYNFVLELLAYFNFVYLIDIVNYIFVPDHDYRYVIILLT